MKHRKIPFLAIAVALVSIIFALLPILTPHFASYRPEHFPVFQEFWPNQSAGWAFSIWGVIYIWLSVGVIWVLLQAPNDSQWQQMRLPLLISLGLGSFWIATANAAPFRAKLMIASMAGFATAAMLRAGNNALVWQVRPAALYSGWLTAATGVGLGVLLAGFRILTAQMAALAMLTAVLTVSLMVQSISPVEWAYPLAVNWALIGVIAANSPPKSWPMMGLSTVGTVPLAVRVF